jgi:outer membrane murein-binding lipoprotein Lpp
MRAWTLGLAFLLCVTGGARSAAKDTIDSRVTQLEQEVEDLKKVVMALHQDNTISRINAQRDDDDRARDEAKIDEMERAIQELQDNVEKLRMHDTTGAPYIP